MASNNSSDDPGLSNLQSNLDEQQAKLSALRESIRQMDAANDKKNASAQEKVRNIAQRLTHFKTKVNTSRMNRASSIHSSSQSLAFDVSQKTAPDGALDSPGSSFKRGRSESSGMEKCSLLLEQIEKNRQKMAQRESSQREIEERVSEIKQKLEVTQQTLEKSSELDRSNISLADIVFTLKESMAREEQATKEFNSLIRSTATRDSRIVLSSTPYDIDIADNTDNVMVDKAIKSEDNEHHIQAKYQTESEKLNDEAMKRKITTLEERMEEKENILDEQVRSITHLMNSFLDGENKSTPYSLSLATKLYAMQEKILEQNYNISTDEARSRLHDIYGYNPLEKAAKNDEIQNEIAAASPPILPEKFENQDKNTNIDEELSNARKEIEMLEQTITSQDAEIERINQQMMDLRQSLEEKSIELNVMTANVSVLQEKLKSSGPKPLFPRSADEELESETFKLKQQLDESNKSMIKCKLKIKQLQKQVDTFKKTSNVHEEVAKLTEEINVLTERLADAEGRTPLMACGDTEVSVVGPELQKRIEMLELTCQNQATAMQLLEEQKNDLSEDLCRTRNELQSLNEHTVAEGAENERIASQMLSIELEEKLEKCLADKTELSKVMQSWQSEQSELRQKLKGYMVENEELLRKIETLGFDKVSSAESIEILENLTVHEEQEMKNTEILASNDGKKPEASESTPESKEDLNENLLKLMEESKELMDKVELFTNERREVLEKLDAISIENQAYVCELDKLKESNEQLRNYNVELASAKSELEDQLRIKRDEKENIMQELGTSKIRESEPETEASGFDSVTQPSTLPSVQHFDTDIFHQSLQVMELEIVNYNKMKDKQKKMQIAKKLSTSAKSMATMSKQLLDEYGRCLAERTSLCEQLTVLYQQKPHPSDELQTTNPAKATGDNDTVINTLRTKLDETTKYLEGKASEVGLLQEEISMLKHELQVAYEKNSDDEPELLRVELSSKNEEITLLKKEIDAMIDAKSFHQLQRSLYEEQKENYRLKTYSTELQFQLETLANRHKEDVEACERQIEKLQDELRNSADVQPGNDLKEEIQHKQETIDALNNQIIELYRTLEEHQGKVDDLDVLKRKTEQKNEELLEKLKKFAANLKRKNAQCTELEKENQQLTESNRMLTEQMQSVEKNVDRGELKEENKQLQDMLYHLKNELHRLLEQKYQMESECQSTRDELQVLNEKLATTQDELKVKSDAFAIDLEQSRTEMKKAQDELANKNGKIEKCKAIIKEKIKETQRLQERDRRTAYLEDELRMTQSKLEDFHNQTLLLGRLKSEKEELNAAFKTEHEQRNVLEEKLTQLQDELDQSRGQIQFLEAVKSEKEELSAICKAEHEQRKCVEEKLTKLQQQMRETCERDSAMNEKLVQFQQWVTWFRQKWCDPPAAEGHLDLASSDMFSWIDVLSETEKHISQRLAQIADELNTFKVHLQSAQSDSNELRVEIDQVRVQLQQAQNENNELARSELEQVHTVEQLKHTLSEVQAELQREVTERLHMASLNTELTGQLSNKSEAEGEVHKLQEEVQRLQHNNAELLNEISLLRENITMLNGEVNKMRAEMAKLTSSEEALRNELEETSMQLSNLERIKCDIETQYKAREVDYQNIHLELEQEKGLKEKLNERLQQRDQELETLRHTYEQQGEYQNNAAVNMSVEIENIRQQLHDVERVRDSLQASLDNFQAKNEKQSHEITELLERIKALETETHQDKSNILHLSSLTEAREVEQKELQQQTDVLQERYNALLEDHEQMKLVLDVQEANLLQVSKQKQEFVEALHSKEQECVELQRKHTELRKEIEQLKEPLDDKQSAIAQQQLQTAVSIPQDTAQPIQENDFGMWDDGDDWGDTARLEGIIAQKDELITQLGMEKELMQEEIISLKVKSGKLQCLLKKCKASCEAVRANSFVSSSNEPSSDDPASHAALVGVLQNKVHELELKLCQVHSSRDELEREQEALRTKADLFETACEKLTMSKEYQDNQIEMLKASLQTAEQGSPAQYFTSEKDDHSARLALEIELLNDRLRQLELRLLEQQQTNQQLEEEKAEMGRELDELNQHILTELQFQEQLNAAQLELDVKGVEIRMLRSTLEQLQQDGSADQSTVSGDVLREEKAALETQVRELERERMELLERLQSSAPEQTQFARSEAVSQSEVDVMAMREALEKQELEIVTLKEQLALRSAEYARLAARVDPTKLFASGLGKGEPIQAPEQQQPQPSGDRVPRAELELALYMIYQRDMRCDELELELRSLLQERDTLQLRLSKALRMHEEFKMRTAVPTTSDHAEGGTSGECSIDASPDRSLTGLPTDERPTSSLSGHVVATDSHELTSKLSELRAISYAKEKHWQEEREDRNRQLSLMQRDLANMPVEAAVQLSGVDAAGTEANSQQSASTVLLNWILGRK